ncbi:hypothetical protein PC115_g7458 [Phytophthora cactorum]|uniref:Retroviral polymerase SH3-like domain-containing protein n=1 Tax=Phytophthora cactorum TaxID=29920 RepID=A0A8T1CV63_9STRA|nr:hypothetical protein PC115_g7458 [Phytophthora cactorum]
MPELLWGEAFMFAVEVLNVSPTSALAGETPYTRRFGERPDISSLRTWGCLAYAFTQKVLRKNKEENPGKPCLFLGYATDTISYRVLSLKTGNIEDCRTVEFAEDWTVERSYVEKLLLNRNSRSNYKLPSKIPYIHMDSLTSPSSATSLGTPDNDEHRNKRQCRQELTDLHTSTVADTPTAVGGPVLPSVPLSGVLSANPTRSAEAEARLSRARGLREWNPAGDCVGTDGGGDAEGEEDLSDSSNSMPSKASLALSSSDDECEDFSGSHSDEHGVIANGEPMEDISRLVGEIEKQRTKRKMIHAHPFGDRLVFEDRMLGCLTLSWIYQQA